MSDKSMGPARKLSNEQEIALVARYKILQSTAKVAIEFGISIATASRTLRRLGVVVERQLTQDEKVLAVTMAQGGATPSAIAKRFGVNELLVVHVLARGNQRQFSVAEENTIVERYMTGESSSDIAKTWSINPSTITIVLLRHQVKLRSTWNNYTEDQKSAVIRARFSDPVKRLRTLLMSRRTTAKNNGLVFDDYLFTIFANNPPTSCACCTVVFDFSETDNAEASPSFDRIDNTKGYVMDNVAVICRRCNRIKSDASLAELKRIIFYIEKHGVK